MNREQKAAVIEEVTVQIKESDAIFAVDYRGLSVPQAAELRTRLRDVDAGFSVVKNTLTERAADAAGVEGLKEFLHGPTAMTFIRGDAAAAAKALRDFRRIAGLPEFKGGWINGATVTAEEIDAIAQLPSRDVLYGRLVSMVAAPLTGLASALSNLISGLARQLSQIADQGLLPAGGAAAPAAEAAPAAAVAEPEAAEAEEPAAAAEAPEPAAEATGDAEGGGPSPEADPDSEPKDVPEPGPDPDPAPESSNEQE
jgi:large subunit ribosomal protein L10